MEDYGKPERLKMRLRSKLKPRGRSSAAHSGCARDLAERRRRDGIVKSDYCKKKKFLMMTGYDMIGDFPTGKGSRMGMESDSSGGIQDVFGERSYRFDPGTVTCVLGYGGHAKFRFLLLTPKMDGTWQLPKG